MGKIHLAKWQKAIYGFNMKVLLIDQIAKVNFRYTYPLVNGLVKNGVDVELVMDLKNEDENCKCKKYRWFNTDEKNIGKIHKIENYIASYLKILNLVKKNKYDIIQTEWFILSPLDYFFLKRIKRVSKAKLVITVHDILPFNKAFYDFYFHSKIYDLADKIILQAPGNESRFLKLFPKEFAKIRIIPHGHMLDYVESVEKSVGRKYLNIPNEKIVLLFFGQIKKVKGVDILLNALSMLKEKHPNLFIVIAGSVWKTDFSECEKIIESNNLNDCLRLDIKYIPDEEIKYYYGAADACVLPYTDVYQSGVIQLSYGYKKVVVSSDLPSFTQFVKEGVSGFISKRGDSSSLAAAIERLIASQERLKDMGLNGYNLVKSELDWNKLTKQMITDCYKQ